ncbi:ATP-binding cassette sub- D member 4 [Gonapodya sp. JEL0774]|nr:ATP-binding cassette sub- D member 4 [Gonapodya sp. JEL0774]
MPLQSVLKNSSKTIFASLLGLAISVPLNILPVLGTVLYAYLNSSNFATERHVHYLVDIKHLDLERTWKYTHHPDRRAEYSQFGFACMLLEMIPVAQSIFVLTNSVGAALWACDIEKGNMAGPENTNFEPVEEGQMESATATTEEARGTGPTLQKDTASSSSESGTSNQDSSRQKLLGSRSASGSALPSTIGRGSSASLGPVVVQAPKAPIHPSAANTKAKMATERSTYMAQEMSPALQGNGRRTAVDSKNIPDIPKVGATNYEHGGTHAVREHSDSSGTDTSMYPSGWIEPQYPPLAHPPNNPSVTTATDAHYSGILENDHQSPEAPIRLPSASTFPPMVSNTSALPLRWPTPVDMRADWPHFHAVPTDHLQNVAQVPSTHPHRLPWIEQLRRTKRTINSGSALESMNFGNLPTSFGGKEDDFGPLFANPADDPDDDEDELTESSRLLRFTGSETTPPASVLDVCLASAVGFEGSSPNSAPPPSRSRFPFEFQLPHPVPKRTSSQSSNLSTSLSARRDTSLPHYLSTSVEQPSASVLFPNTMEDRHGVGRHPHVSQGGSSNTLVGGAGEYRFRDSSRPGLSRHTSGELSLSEERPSRREPTDISHSRHNAVSAKPSRTAALDRTFLARLGAIVSLLFRDRRVILAYVSLIFVSCAAEVAYYFAGTTTARYYVVLNNRDWAGFLLVTVYAVLLYLAIALLKAMVRWVGGYFALRGRRILSTSLTDLYVSEKNLYRITRGLGASDDAVQDPTDGVDHSNPNSGRIDNPEQRITQDVDGLMEMLRQVLEALIITPLTVAYYTYRTYAVSGLIGPTAIYSYFIVSSVAVRYLLAPLVPLIYRKQQLEGDYRFLHTHVRTNAESIAVLGGESTERHHLARSLDALLAWQRMVLDRDSALKIGTEFVGYLGSVLTYVTVAVPIFAGAYDDVPAGELSGLISLNSYVCMYLRENLFYPTRMKVFKFTQIITMAEQISDVAGFVSRIGHMMEVCQTQTEKGAGSFDRPGSGQSGEESPGKGVNPVSQGPSAHSAPQTPSTRAAFRSSVANNLPSNGFSTSVSRATRRSDDFSQRRPDSVLIQVDNPESRRHSIDDSAPEVTDQLESPIEPRRPRRSSFRAGTSNPRQGHQKTDSEGALSVTSGPEESGKPSLRSVQIVRAVSKRQTPNQRPRLPRIQRGSPSRSPPNEAFGPLAQLRMPQTGSYSGSLQESPFKGLSEQLTKLEAPDHPPESPSRYRARITRVGLSSEDERRRAWPGQASSHTSDDMSDAIATAHPPTPPPVPLVVLSGLTVATPTEPPRTLLQGISLKLNVKDRVLLTGKNGAGKTSLLRTIRGLWKPMEGEIVISGSLNGKVGLDGAITFMAKGSPSTLTISTPPSDSASLSRDPPVPVIFLPQQPYISQCSLRDQITYPLRTSSVDRQLISDPALLALLRSAAMPDLIERCHGADTILTVEEWERILSPGERQKVCLARAAWRLAWEERKASGVYGTIEDLDALMEVDEEELAEPSGKRNAGFVFMDEATSSIDPPTAHQILHSLFVSRGIGWLRIAHGDRVKEWNEGVWSVDSSHNVSVLVEPGPRPVGVPHLSLLD